MPGPLDFWKIVKEINPRVLREEAERPFRVAAIGTPEELAVLRRKAGLDTQEARAFAGDRWREAVLPLGPESLARIKECTFAVALSNVKESPVPAWMLEPENQEAMRLDLQAILDAYPNLILALPRYIPLFRREASARIIAATSRTNAEIALVSAIPGIVPWTAILLPVTALPDMWLLTKNQVMMCLRLAAIHGLEVEPVARIRELGGIVGAAFGWRALTRQLVGAVPGGVGVVSKGAVAYAGTAATGRAAQAFYETGRRPTDAERRTLYASSLRQGREVVNNLWERMRRQPSPEPEPSQA